MAQTILLKRGLEANRGAQAFATGEMVWTTDGHKLFVGDGSTAGGLAISYLGTELVGANDGVASLGADGKIPTSQLPDLSLTSTNVVDNENDQLALTLEEGDVVVRTDLNKTFIHNGGTAGDMTDFQELLSPTDAVSSVNGKTGAVVLDGSDILATGYTGAETGAIAADDSMNVALAKLEHNVNDRVYDLGYTASATDGTVTNTAGADATLPVVDGTNAGLMVPADKTKLDGIADGAEVNVQSDWTQATDTEDDYIKNKPTDLTDLTVHDLDELRDVTITSVADKDFIRWDAANGIWVNSSPETLAIDDLSDVDTSTTPAANSDVLQYDGTNWVPVNVDSVGRTTFVALDDTPADYSGSAEYTVKVNAAGDALEFVDTSTIDGGAF